MPNVLDAELRPQPFPAEEDGEFVRSGIELSVDVLPVSTEKKVVNHSSVHWVVLGDPVDGFPGPVANVNFADLGFRKFGSPITRSNDIGSVPVSIRKISGLGVNAKIFRPVVGNVSIVVADDHSSRDGANECFVDESVGKVLPLETIQVEAESTVWFLDGNCRRQDSSERFFANRPDVAKVRYFVESFVSNNRTPNFDVHGDPRSCERSA